MNNLSNDSKPPLIAIAIMVKNEEVSIQATLYSLFKSGMRDFFVLDTGSTDKTIDIAERFFKQHQLNGYIQQEPFVDFSTSRNRTLELAEQHFPHIPFLLMPDAEWSLRNGKALHRICEREIHSKASLYSLTIKVGELEFTTARLFRAASRIRFVGVVHELPEPVKRVRIHSRAYFQADPTARGHEKSKRRWQQDLLLLSKAYHDNPQDSRNTYYLAQTYECLNDVENAYRFYQCREKLTGCPEEYFTTLLRLGRLSMLVKQTDNLPGWATAMDYFLKAYAQRPHRIEPLVHIADHYWPDNIQACYLFAQQAYDKPYPINELHCINKTAYQYTRYEIMSRCAWHMGEYALGEQATLLALQARPGTEHLLNNLKLYRQKLNHASS